MPTRNYEVRAQIGGAQVVLWRGSGSPDGVGVIARQMYDAFCTAMHNGVPVTIEPTAGKILAEAGLSSLGWTEVVLQGPDGMFERMPKNADAPAPRA